MQEFLDKRKPSDSQGVTITALNAEEVLEAMDKEDMKTLAERLKQLHLAQLGESAEINARALKKLVKAFKDHYAGTTSQGHVLGDAHREDHVEPIEAGAATMPCLLPPKRARCKFMPQQFFFLQA